MLVWRLVQATGLRYKCVSALAPNTGAGQLVVRTAEVWLVAVWRLWDPSSRHWAGAHSAQAHLNTHQRQGSWCFLGADPVLTLG